MPAPTPTRAIGDLTYTEIGAALRASSVLCLPMGSMEQHGPHLPLNTDTVLAEAFTGRIVERWGETYDLWRLPPVAVGLSREHAWAPGTLSLSVTAMTAYLRDLAREIVRSLPARNLLIVNGHGGNRGILEAIGRELRGDFGLNLCAVHLGALISPLSEGEPLEIHAGRDETSVMLVLASELVRRDRIPALKSSPGGDAVRLAVLDPAASWPWSSDDQRLARLGVIGNAAAASPEHGSAIVARVIEATGEVLRRLAESRKGAGD
jgi:creatinine amidohydrolase